MEIVSVDIYMLQCLLCLTHTQHTHILDKIPPQHYAANLEKTSLQAAEVIKKLESKSGMAKPVSCRSHCDPTLKFNESSVVSEFLA